MKTKNVGSVRLSDDGGLCFSISFDANAFEARFRTYPASTGGGMWHNELVFNPNDKALDGLIHLLHVLKHEMKVAAEESSKNPR